MPNCDKCIWSTRSGNCVLWECKFVSYEDARRMIEEKERKDEKTVRTMKVELKPCPFCGGQPEIVTPEETDGQYWFIACTNDNCWGIAVSDFCETESEAIDKWNHRENGENNEDND